jgi:coenzyme PQQ synthesis protein D (PqqD)
MIRLTSTVRTVTNADGAALLDLRRGKLYRLNATGSVIAELLAHGTTQQDLRAELIRRCRSDPNEALMDVLEFIGCLSRDGLIEERN